MEAEVQGAVLQQGDMLNWYRIDKVLGRGGFGITYLATDTNLQKHFAIKEYLPERVASRNPDNSLRPSSPEMDQTFQWGLDRFIKEARTLAKFKHNNIVRVSTVFEANGTAYMVMDYEHGLNFKEYLSHHPDTSERNLKAIFNDVLDGLKRVHDSGFIHRDIKPANIIIRENGSPVLIDFGSARQSYGSHTHALTSLVSVGYAPLEQYSESGSEKQGPWTDIYACGAVLYYAIAGSPPPDATQRGSALINNAQDPMAPIRTLAAERYSEKFLHAIDWALSFAIDKRPQNLQHWMPELLADAPLSARPPPPDDDRTVIMPREASTRTGRSPSQATMRQSERTTKRQDDPLIQQSATASAQMSAPGSRAQQGVNSLPSSFDDEEWDISAIQPVAPARQAASRAGRSHKPRNKKSKLPMLMLAASALIAVASLAYWFYPELVSPQASVQSGGASSVSASSALAVANRDLALLADAISNTDMQALASFGQVSLKNRQILSILFRHFAKIEVAVEEFNKGNADKTELTLVQLTRADGTIAKPAKSLRSLTVERDTSSSAQSVLKM